MRIERRSQDGIPVIALQGELDGATAAEVQQGLAGLATASGDVLLDLHETTYVASAGLRVLLLLRHQAWRQRARLALVGASPEVLRILTVTGLRDAFVLADTVEEGVARLRRPAPPDQHNTQT